MRRRARPSVCYDWLGVEGDKDEDQRAQPVEGRHHRRSEGRDDLRTFASTSATPSSPPRSLTRPWTSSARCRQAGDCGDQGVRRNGRRRVNGTADFSAAYNDRPMIIRAVAAERDVHEREVEVRSRAPSPWNVRKLWKSFRRCDQENDQQSRAPGGENAEGNRKSTDQLADEAHRCHHGRQLPPIIGGPRLPLGKICRNCGCRR